MKSLNKGFTLSELMLSAAILLIAILGLLTVFINCIFLNESNGNQITAVNDAQFVLEQIKSLSYADIPSYTPPELNNLNNETITVTRSYPSTRLTEVAVNVKWEERNREKNLQLSTCIAREKE